MQASEDFRWQWQMVKPQSFWADAVMTVIVLMPSLLLRSQIHWKAHKSLTHCSWPALCHDWKELGKHSAEWTRRQKLEGIPSSRWSRQSYIRAYCSLKREECLIAFTGTGTPMSVIPHCRRLGGTTTAGSIICQQIRHKQKVVSRT